MKRDSRTEKPEQKNKPMHTGNSNPVRHHGSSAAHTETHEHTDARAYFRLRSQQHWDRLGKPIDSLGVLEKHVTKLCMIERTEQPRIEKRARAVLCADHGCVREGVTQTDSSVTRIVAENFVRGLTTTSVLARQFAVDIFPIDVGMLGISSRPMLTSALASVVTQSRENSAARPSISEMISASGRLPDETEGYVPLRTDLVNDRCLQQGSGDIAIEPAMSEEVGKRALALGRALVRELKSQGYDVLLTGEMGIGNTTPTSALFSAFLGLPVEETVGRGAGISDEGLARKRDCVRRALRRVGKKTAKQLLFELGGLEIATMAGMFLGAVEEQMPIVIDGAISTAAALAASRILEEEMISDEGHATIADYALASHVSKDGAARKALEALGLRAIIDADMSLGEGSGAVLLMPMLDAALAVYRGMGSFEDIHVEAYHRFK